MIKSIKKDCLEIRVYATRAQMGKAAGDDAAAALSKLLAEKQEVNMIFAAAPSQNETLDTLCSHTELDWSRVNAFHMDEYVGLPKEHEQSFGHYLYEHCFSKLPFKSINYINGAAADIAEECARYTKLLKQYPTDIVCLGIGENGHIAFNDPHVADFEDPVYIKQVVLDEKCRNQQVHDKCFPALEYVPKTALSLTVPALFKAKTLICSVPAATKADAVYATVNGDISERCPATIMRKHSDAVMYCDKDSGIQIL